MILANNFIAFKVSLHFINFFCSTCVHWIGLLSDIHIWSDRPVNMDWLSTCQISFRILHKELINVIFHLVIYLAPNSLNIIRQLRKTLDMWKKFTVKITKDKKKSKTKTDDTAICSVGQTDTWGNSDNRCWLDKNRIDIYFEHFDDCDRHFCVCVAKIFYSLLFFFMDSILPCRNFEASTEFRITKWN